ncbi:hypothetical protein BC749_12017 [Flavobacterium araucananum]|uniref:Uncharacterized protein n=2 Tax=Flavobacterium araucananum TaxID=946678 RepID=A0A227PD57_9FLAO|nr:hypothetical protein B0A64_07555 [Flavobacterium araucananum]PWJ90652.1 hypothetical protein BC749_12017 [Flavobacterium araucananum]
MQQMIKEISTIIFNHLSEHENQRNITLEKTELIEIDNGLLSSCENDIRERLKIKLSKGFCSKILIEQLSFHKANYGEKFGDKVEYFNTPEILNLIENLENKKIIGLPFTGELLKPYLHIHLSPFSSLGYSLVRNIKEFWFKKGTIRNEKSNEFEEIVKKYNVENLSAIANEMHQKAISNKDLKGEWLIYRTENDINYYLCLASHREGKDRKESDENIFKMKIEKCLTEFTQLK